MRVVALGDWVVDMSCFLTVLNASLLLQSESISKTLNVALHPRISEDIEATYTATQSHSRDSVFSCQCHCVSLTVVSVTTDIPAPRVPGSLPGPLDSSQLRLSLSRGLIKSKQYGRNRNQREAQGMA